MPTPVPTYLNPGESYSTILTRLLQYLAKYDTGDGGTWRMLEAPIALELDRWRQKAIQLVADLFLQTATSAGLDAWGVTLSLPRKQPTSSTLTLTLTGIGGSFIQAGTVVSTIGTTAAAPVQFVTTTDVTFLGTSITVPANAFLAGSNGNVSAGTITSIVTPRTGLTAVTNLAPATGGTDLETDDAYRTRLALKFLPTTGGNVVDYETWVLEQDDVGAVSIVPQRDFPTNVSIAIVGPAPDYATVSQTTIDAVQDALMKPFRLGPYEAEATTGSGGWNRAGAGVSQAADAAASGGQALRFQANAALGEVSQNVIPFQTLLPEAGIYVAYFLLKRAGTLGTGNFASIGVWNASQANWAKTAPSDAAYGGALITYTGAQLTTSYAWYSVRFYWNGTDTLYPDVRRLINTGGNDTSTELWFDQDKIVSVQGDGKGLTPVCHNVVVQAGVDVPIDVQATLTKNIPSGFTSADVTNAAIAALQDYLSSIVFSTTNNDVLFSQISNALLNTQLAGVSCVTDLTGLQIKKSSSGTWTTSSIVIGPQEVARQGTFTLS